MENVQTIVLGWPALMKLETASQYLSLDSQTFQLLANRNSVFPVIIEDDETRWRKVDLDKLIRRLPHETTYKSPGPSVRVLRLDESSLETLATSISGKLKTEKPGNASRLVSIRETADLMGVGRSTIYRLIESGELTKLKIGRRTLIERDSIDQLLAP